ncbi:MAG: hypothetical protein D6719_01985 [Candidatus Dadabacteria bacterium]|nr:MAG: hypothetical protein D6719_01985 [Candidatus Dadabacteria bacterium]
MRFNPDSKDRRPFTLFEEKKPTLLSRLLVALQLLGLFLLVRLVQLKLQVFTLGHIPLIDDLLKNILGHYQHSLM